MTAYSPIQLQGRTTMLETARAVSERCLTAPTADGFAQLSDLRWDLGESGLDVYPQQTRLAFVGGVLSWNVLGIAAFDSVSVEKWVDHEENAGDYNGLAAIPIIDDARWRVLTGFSGDYDPGMARYYQRDEGVIDSGIDYPQTGHFLGGWLHEDLRAGVDPLRWTLLQLNGPAEQTRIETSVERLYGESGAQESEAEAKSAAIAALAEGGSGTSSYAAMEKVNDENWRATVQLVRVTHTLVYDVSAFDLGEGEGEYFLPTFENCDLYVKPKAVGVFSAQGTANLTDGEHYRHATGMEDTDTFALGHLTAGSIVWPATPDEGETNTTGWDYDVTAPIAKWEFTNYVDEE